VKIRKRRKNVEMFHMGKRSSQQGWEFGVILGSLAL
jgi:hypothetical protein